MKILGDIIYEIRITLIYSWLVLQDQRSRQGHRANLLKCYS